MATTQQKSSGRANGKRHVISRHYVRNRVRDMILDGRLRPGIKLVQQQLAKDFGVSQGVVREALLELKPMGLIDSTDNKGLYVSQLTIETLLESFDVRETHEGLVARLCCERMTRGVVRELQHLVERCYEFGTLGEVDEMSRVDREFHRRLLEESKNRMLIRLAEHYTLLGKVARLDRPADVVRDEHLAVLRAIEAGNGDDAERYMRDHIRAAKQVLEQRVRDGRTDTHWLI